MFIVYFSSCVVNVFIFLLKVCFDIVYIEGLIVIVDMTKLEQQFLENKKAKEKTERQKK